MNNKIWIVTKESVEMWPFFTKEEAVSFVEDGVNNILNSTENDWIRHDEQLIFDGGICDNVSVIFSHCGKLVDSMDWNIIETDIQRIVAM